MIANSSVTDRMTADSHTRERHVTIKASDPAQGLYAVSRYTVRIKHIENIGAGENGLGTSAVNQVQWKECSKKIALN